MQLSSILFATRARILVLFTILSMILVACDMSTDPESENLSFEGPPEVTISSPLNGDTYREGVGVNILLRVDNAGPDVDRISIKVDGEIIGEAILPNESGAANFTVNNGWPATGEGPHTISAVASRSDGTVSEEASVSINVVAAATSANEDTDDADTSADDDSDSQADEQPVLPTPVPTQDTSAQQVAPTNTAAAQATAAATNTPAPTNTASRPQVTIRTGANVRSGPGTVFDPPIGSLAAGATANILALNTAGTWYKIEYYNGDGWVSALVVDVTGNTSSLPREAGPPTPVPPSPVPPTNTPLPASNVDLIIDAAQTSVVPTFRCGQSSEITITVINAGSADSTATVVVAEDVQPDGSIGANTQAPVPALGPNESAKIVLYLTVSTFVSEAHTFRARVDGNNSVNESNENNNDYTYRYSLETGTC